MKTSVHEDAVCKAPNSKTTRTLSLILNRSVNDYGTSEVKEGKRYWPIVSFQECATLTEGGTELGKNGEKGEA